MMKRVVSEVTVYLDKDDVRTIMVDSCKGSGLVAISLPEGVSFEVHGKELIAAIENATNLGEEK